MLRQLGLLLLCSALVVAPLHAQTCADDAEATAELQRIESMLAGERFRASLWWYGWLGYAAVEGGFGAVAYARAHDRLDRDLWLVTWVGSAALGLELALFPMVSIYAPRRLAKLPRDTPAARCAAHARAERLLERAADFEREGTNALAHALGAAWAVGTTAYLLGRNYDGHSPIGARHNRRVIRESGLDLLWTVVVTELAIWTQPTDAMRYGALRRPSPAGAQISVAAGLNHAALRITF